MTYSYDASGAKLTKQTTNVTRQYIDVIEYLGSTIDLLHTENGIARNSGGTYTYEYFLKDHLGNTRIVYNNGGTVLQQTDYYPFGLDIARYQAVPNKYLYNGKEKQEELNQYDYKFRFFDPVIGRFHTVDRLADKYVYYTPYQFAGNEVPNAIDLDGLEPLTINKSTRNLVLVLQGYGGNPPNGATQAINAAKTNPSLGPDTELGSIHSSGSGLQVGTYASSTSNNTNNDVLATIKEFRQISPDGKVTMVGHSQGGDNIMELAVGNKDVKIDLAITLDIKDASNSGIFSIDNNVAPSNMKNVINYYQEGEVIGGTKVSAADNSKTNVVNKLSPGSNHRSIDNDLLNYIKQDINNFLKGKDAVDEARKRSLPKFNPANTNSPNINISQ